MAVWLLNSKLVSICIQKPFMYVDYTMNYLTKLQTAELEKAGLHQCIDMRSIYLADRKLNKHILFNQNGSVPLSWTTEDCIE